MRGVRGMLDVLEAAPNTEFTTAQLATAGDCSAWQVRNVVKVLRKLKLVTVKRVKKGACTSLIIKKK
jgi:DNA-binding IscR family transcriptional regulator